MRVFLYGVSETRYEVGEHKEIEVRKRAEADLTVFKVSLLRGVSIEI